MAHALLARRLGIEIEGITLWLFGGVARFRAEAAGPGGELRIAVIGPAVSLALAAVFLALTAALAGAGAPGLAIAAASWLSLVNALLAGFNILPAFPLDGGRVLRALLWMRWRRLSRATVAAARVGALLAYLLIGLGIAFFFLSDVFNGVWFAFLGWFLLTAARAEEANVVLGDALAGVLVRDVMTPDPLVAPGWITVEELIRSYVLVHRHSTFPVRDFEGRLQGLVTLALVRQVPAERRGTTRVADIAHPIAAVTIASPEEPVSGLVTRLGRGAGGRALVLEGERLVGIVSPTDVTRVLSVAGARSDALHSPRA
jgi:Zn-dependent protease